MNLIEKHHIEINCSQQTTAQHFKDEVGLVFEQHLYPKLEDVLNRYDVSDCIWSIEALEVQIPNLVLSNWKHDLVNSILYKVEEFLIANQPKDKRSSAGIIEDNDKIIHKDTFCQQLLIQYLTKGILPENALTTDLKTVFNTVKIDSNFWSLLQTEIEQNTTLFNTLMLRWVLNLPKKLSKDLAQELGVLNNFKALNELLKSHSRKQSLFGQYLFWLSAFKEYFSHLKTITVEEDVLKAVDTHFNMSREEALKSMTSWQLEVRSQASKKEMLNIFLTELDRLAIYMNREDIKKQDHTVADAMPKNEIDAILEALQGGNAKPTDTSKPFYYIKNAGLVILQPYCVTLFTTLGYLEEQQWKSPYFQHRAVLLLQYLIYGEAKIFESELLLNKLLCGVGLTETVWVEWEISETEKEQCQELLTSVIEHWSILKNTSIETLRDSFLQRNAKLVEYKENTYELIVEEKSIDVLLDHLPWGIGTLKTPWMEHYLSCQWN